LFAFTPWLMTLWEKLRYNQKAHAGARAVDSVLAPLYVGADLLDAFAIHLPGGAQQRSRSAGSRRVRAAGGVDSRADLGADARDGDVGVKSSARSVLPRRRGGYR